MADSYASDVPQTLEGWYILHDVHAVDWPAWRATDAASRERIVAEASAWLTAATGVEKGDSAAYSVVTQKGDLMFVHYRETPAALNRVELSLRQTEGEAGHGVVSYRGGSRTAPTAPPPSAA